MLKIIIIKKFHYFKIMLILLLTDIFYLFILFESHREPGINMKEMLARKIYTVIEKYFKKY